MQFINRWSRCLIILALTTLIIWASWGLRVFSNNAIEVAYAGYVATEYLTEQKRLTGQWPTDLNGLAQSIHEERARRDLSRLVQIEQYHFNNHPRLKPVHSDGYSYTYILFLKSGPQTWTARLKS